MSFIPTDAYNYLAAYDYIDRFRQSNNATYPLITVYENHLTDTQVYIFRDLTKPGAGDGKGVLVIAFPGSESWQDWLRDFCFAQRVIPYDNQETAVRVHEGFLGAYKSVRQRILNLTTGLNMKNVVVMGHSLGAAIAQLAAVDISYNQGAFPDSVLTYGSPRVGNKAWADSFNRRIPAHYRFVNQGDVVPMVPIWGYQHTGTEIKVRGGWGHLIPAYLQSVLMWSSAQENSPTIKK